MLYFAFLKVRKMVDFIRAVVSVDPDDFKMNKELFCLILKVMHA